jgi:hypothetical protein
MFLDLGLKPSHIEKMAMRFKIHPKINCDMLWIMYLYCLFIIRYSPSNNASVLEKLISTDLYDVPYDDFFYSILVFNQIKAEVLLRKLN